MLTSQNPALRRSFWGGSRSGFSAWRVRFCLQRRNFGFAIFFRNRRPSWTEWMLRAVTSGCLTACAQQHASIEEFSSSRSLGRARKPSGTGSMRGCGARRRVGSHLASSLSRQYGICSPEEESCSSLSGRTGCRHRSRRRHLCARCLVRKKSSSRGSRVRGSTASTPPHPRARCKCTLWMATPMPKPISRRLRRQSRDIGRHPSGEDAALGSIFHLTASLIAWPVACLLICTL